MNSNTVLYIIIAALAGFIAGFMLANKLNGSEMAALRAQSSQPAPPGNSAVSKPGTAETLTDDELRSKIAEADKNPSNFSFQKDLGVSLYRYAAMKQDEDLLAESVRILERAEQLNPKDFDVLVALGNAHFDIGFYKSELKSFETARKVYEKALEIKPSDADVQTDLGLTYYLQEPPALDKAAAQLQKTSEANPTHERSLQFLVRTFVKQNRTADAQKALAKLKNLNSSYPAIPELESLVSGVPSSPAK